MMGWLLDTNLPSELVRPKPSAVVREWFLAQDPSSLYLSVITLGELRAGFVLDTQADRRERLAIWYESKLLPAFVGQILPVTQPIAEVWGKLTARGRTHGRPLPQSDGLLAATALVHNLGVATRNVKDFAQTGVTLLNPWEL